MITAAQVIADYLDAATRAGASRSTLRQRSWALALLLEQVQEMIREGEVDPTPGSGPLAISTFVELLPQAESRLVASRPDAPIPTVRAWRAAIRALAAQSGLPVSAAPLPAPVARKVLSSEGVRALETLRQRQLITLMPEEQARLSMVLALLTAAPLTGTQLCGVRTGDLDERLETLTVTVARRHWRRLDLQAADVDNTTPKLSSGDPTAAPSSEEVQLALPAYVKDAIIRWFAVRDPLVRSLQGSTNVLLVSVAANHDPRTSAVLPPGLPLKPRGLQRSFTRAALAANAELVGQPGFPLPTSLELARRSYHAWRTA